MTLLAENQRPFVVAGIDAPIIPDAPNAFSIGTALGIPTGHREPPSFGRAE